MIRILLVEEEALVRAALQKLLESWSGLEVIGEAATKDEARDLIRRLEPDLVLLSLSNSNEPLDLQTIHDLAQASERARLLVLMGQCDQSVPLQVVLHGARGIVQKNRAAGELKKAIHKVYESEEMWLDRASVARLIAQVSAATRGRNANGGTQLAVLTTREREIVAHVVDGRTNKEVGERLFISETTVRHHLTKIFNKLNVSNRFELFAYLRRHPFPWSDGSGRNSRAGAQHPADSER